MRRLSILIVVLLTLVGLAPAAHAGTATPPGLPQSMAAAGDSITRGFDATLFGCFLVDCPVYSWSTGTSPFVHSHYSRIRAAQPGVPVTAVNVARTGAKMAELDGQLQMVRRSVQYVTVLMGANDLGTSSPQTMTPTATFRASFDTALANYKNRPKSYVFSAGDVSPIDYFHSSVGGQAKLAAVTWAASFWPNR